MSLAAAFLDYGSLDMNDLDFSSLRACFNELQLYESTAPEQVIERLSHVEVVLAIKLL